MRQLIFLLIFLAILCSGCNEAKLYGRGGKVCYGIPFGQSSSEMQYRKHILKKFGLVKPGMNKKDVLDKFGEPAHKSISNMRSLSGNNYQIWYYNSIYSDQHSMLIEKVYIYFDDYKVIDPP